METWIQRHAGIHFVENCSILILLKLLEFEEELILMLCLVKKFLHPFLFSVKAFE